MQLSLLVKATVMKWLQALASMSEAKETAALEKRLLILLMMRDLKMLL